MRANTEALTRCTRIDAALRESGWRIVPNLPGTPFASYHHAAVTEFPTANSPAASITSAIHRELPGVLHAWIPSQPISAHRVSDTTQRPLSFSENNKPQAQRYTRGVSEFPFPSCIQ